MSMSGNSPNGPGTGPPGVSPSDILSVFRNVVQAINNAAQTYLNVQGAQNRAAIAAATLLKSGPGRIAVISVTTAGAATGIIYDAATATATTNPIYIIPMAVGVYVVNLPYSFGLVVVPGTNQVLTASYS